MKSGSIPLALCFVALGGATLASTLVALDPLPRHLLRSAPSQSAVLLVAPAGAFEIRDTAAPAIVHPAADRDFDAP